MKSKYKPAVIGKLYIDASDSVLGRLASEVVKKLSEGYEVYIFNAEKAIITGNKNYILEFYRHRIFERGDWYKGPFYPRRPDRILRRVIRGMLPKNYIGRVLLSRIKVFIGIPDEYKNVNMIRIESAALENRPKIRFRKFIYLGELSKLLGSKF